MARRIAPLALALLMLLAAPAYAARETTQDVSSDLTLDSGNRTVDISPDGRYVVFQSQPGTSGNTYAQVWLLDTSTGARELVSRTASGMPGDSDSASPSVSADGRYVAFESTAGNIGPFNNDGVNRFDTIYVLDRTTGQIDNVSRNSNSVPANQAATAPDISDSGQFVTFLAKASNLNANHDTALNVYVRDRSGGTTNLISPRTSNGSLIDARAPVISGDGSRVAFATPATNLVGGSGSGVLQVYSVNTTGNPSLVEVSRSGGTEGNAGSNVPSISRDGRRIAFQTVATNLGGNNASGVHDVLVRDENGQLRSVGQANDGQLQDLSVPSISADGNHVAFRTSQARLYMRTLSTNALDRIDLPNGPDNNSAGGSSDAAARLSDNGRYAAFGSTTPLTGGSDSDRDAFRRDILGAPPVNTGAPTLSGNAVVGATITCLPGNWSDSPTQYAYQWFRDSTAVTDGSAYVVTDADAGHAIHCRVTASTAAGSGSADTGSLSVPGGAAPAQPTPAPTAVPKPTPTPTPNPIVVVRAPTLALAVATTKFSVKRGTKVKVQFALTAAAKLTLTVRKSNRVVTRVRGTAKKSGRFSLTWDARKVKTGTYKLSLRAAPKSGKAISQTITVTIKPRGAKVTPPPKAPTKVPPVTPTPTPTPIPAGGGCEFVIGGC